MAWMGMEGRGGREVDGGAARVVMVVETTDGQSIKAAEF